MELDARVPFASAFTPWVAAAQEQIVGSAYVDGAAIEGLARALLRRLSGFGSLAALELFERARATGETYDVFTASAAERLVDEFPGFERIASQACSGWVGATQTLVDRIGADLAEVAPGARHAVEIVSGLGDPHRGNQQVALVTFDDGSQRFYKPRSVRPEAVFYNLVGQSSDLVPELPSVWDCGTHGWMSPVLTDAVTDPGTYWRRVGRMVRVLQVFGVTDLHLSNVICTGEQLVPVDLECFLSPEIVVRDEGDAAARFQRDSAMLTGLLPRLEPQDGPVAVDWSGLTGRSGQLNGRWRPSWMGLGTCDIRRGRAPMQTPSASNTARNVDGRVIPLQLDELLGGYQDEQRRWTPDQVDLDALRHIASRVILRPTAVYSGCLATLMNPEELRCADVIERAASSLLPFDDVLATALDGAVDGVYGAERASLGQLDIPLFTMQDQTMDLDGRAQATIGCRTGVDGLVDRLERSADPGWCRADAALVQVALEAGTGQRASGSAGERVADARDGLRPARPLLKVAEEIGNELLDDAIELHDGRLVWADAVPHGASGRLRVALDPPGIYQGGSGIALFLAALAVVSGDQRWSDAARAAIDPSPSVEHPAYESGLAGHAWALAVVGKLLDDSVLGETAVDLAVGVEIRPAPVPGHPTKLELVGGAAGTTAALAAVARHAGNAQLADRAVESGKHLATLVTDALDDEIERRSVIRLGMAHGSTGIIHALGAVSMLSDDEDISSAFDQLVQIEDERILRRNGIGGRIDESRRRRVPSSTWCWGVSGFLLARSMPWFDQHRHVDQSSLEASFAALVAGASNLGHSCCGNAGHLEAALAAARLGLEGADQVVANRVRLLSGVRHGAPFHPATAFSSPSLFRGSAGVGLALLRAAVPNIWLPNPLIVD